MNGSIIANATTKKPGIFPSIHMLLFLFFQSLWIHQVQFCFSLQRFDQIVTKRWSRIEKKKFKSRCWQRVATRKLAIQITNVKFAQSVRTRLLLMWVTVESTWQLIQEKMSLKPSMKHYYWTSNNKQYWKWLSRPMIKLL